MPAASAMPVQPLGSDGPLVSRIALGCADLSGTWNPPDYGPENVRRAITAYETALDAGITLFDTADIYGGTTSEKALRECLLAVPGSRERIAIATKCTIVPGHYNQSREHILGSLRGSLDRMGVDYVDLYQMHRPDPFTHPRETAGALAELLRSGLVRAVGVSNYLPEQVRALQTYLDAPIRTNQFSLSLMRLAPVYEGAEGMGGDGTLDQCMAMNITPLAYRPIAGGQLAGRGGDPSDEAFARTMAALGAVGARHGATTGQIALAWVLAHPAGVVALVGSTNPAHIREAADAARIQLTRQEWFELWTAARGKPVP